ncbi:MAG: S41 family peptidase [Ignavibacteria bacterium]|nr:MAG: S41 family peptidase [Ignavibacteria bacterium]
MNTSKFRDTTENEESWTASYVPGKRMPDVPLFILTSSRTFSAAEEFAYDLQSMKRGTIVGEATGGGAHHNEFMAIDSNFVMSVSIGQAVNPITHTNWEGVGVKPDIATRRFEETPRVGKRRPAKALARLDDRIALRRLRSRDGARIDAQEICGNVRRANHHTRKRGVVLPEEEPAKIPNDSDVGKALQVEGARYFPRPVR